MAKLPKIGMPYEMVKEKLVKFDSAKKNPAMRRSLLNQVRNAEGNKAVQELIKETSHIFNKGSTPRSGYSPMYSQKFSNIKWA